MSYWSLENLLRYADLAHRPSLKIEELRERQELSLIDDDPAMPFVRYWLRTKGGGLEGLTDHLIVEKGVPQSDFGKLPLARVAELLKEKLTTKSVAKSGGQLPNATAKSDVSLDARALGVFIEHPDWTKKKIAKHLQTNEKCLAPKRCPKLAAAIAAHKTRIDPSRRQLHGTKDREGKLEAWEEERKR